MTPRARTALLVLLAIAAGIAAALLLRPPGESVSEASPPRPERRLAAASGFAEGTSVPAVGADRRDAGAREIGAAQEADPEPVTTSAAPDATTPTAGKKRRGAKRAPTGVPNFHVRVVNDAGGAPVPRAEVEIAAVVAGARARRTNDTDKTGTAAFEDVGAGPAALKVTAPGFARSRLEGGHDLFEKLGTVHPVRIDGDALARGVTVRLARGAEVRGRVVGPDGAPAAGAALEILDEAGEQAAGAHTDERGAFCLDTLDLPPGARVRVRARREGFAPGEVEARATVVSAAGGPEGTEVVVRLGRGAVIAGRVTSPSGAPVAGARISVKRQGWSIRSKEEEPSSADDGTFAFPGIEPGTVEVIVRASGYATWRREMEARAGDAPNTVDAALEVGSSFSLRLVDPRGAPLDIEADLTATADMEGTPVVTATFKRGRATLEGLEPRPYRLFIGAGEGRSRSFEVARVLPSGEAVDVVVPDVVRIRLRIAPIVFERVTMSMNWYYELDGSTSRWDHFNVSRDDDGRYTHEFVSRGVEAFWVMSRFFAPVRVALPAVAAAPGEVVDVTATVDGGGSVSGIVLDAKGRQVASARILVHPAGVPEFLADRRYREETSLAGTFHVFALPTGVPIEIIVEREAALGGGRASIRLEPMASGEAREGLTLTLSEGP